MIPGINRRGFLTGLARAGAIATAPTLLTSTTLHMGAPEGLKPQHLKEGDTVRLVAPAGVIYEKIRVQIAMESMTALGFTPTLGGHVFDRYGYFAGQDEDRAADIMDAFMDPAVKGVFALTGGWGSARTLPYLDYQKIAANPKVLMGYSDITALLNGIYAQTGLTTFHGPNATSRWDDFSTKRFKAMVMDAKAVHLENPQERQNSLAVRENRTQTIYPGKAQGILVGGNLTVLSALAGTPYMPDMKGKLLFLEDIGEDIYRVDRMLSTLALGGVFQQVSGVIYGGFTRVDNDGAGFGSFALMDVFEHYAARTNKPMFYGAMLGHIAEKSTIPIGAMAEMDADKGSIHLIEPAVL